ncbi:TetR/AcrR family transcriptional regulator [Agromyces sp. SYSU T0242]|uniref:TetR/AcrR family transcriptional regulator n=1 Tax=Agromyces litoreus TaxID=3158561 RepID=UPI003394FBFE
MRPGPRRSLTHAEILDVAFDLLEEKGPDAVSVRGVAGALGLTPTALYTYYANKGALLHGMVEQVFGRMAPGRADVADPEAARDRIVALAGSLRSALAERPGLVALLLQVPLDGPHARRFDEEVLAAFTGAGLELRAAGRAAHAVRVHVLGAVAFDAAEAGRLSDGGEAAFPAAAADTLWDDVEPTPLGDRVRAVGDDAGARFDWGLRRLLDGILADES